MFQRKLLIVSVLVLVFALAACGNGGEDTADTPSEDVRLDADYANALPVSAQLAIGTLMLEETDDAVTVEQAGDLLPNWQMLQSLQASGTAAQAELDVVLKQIQRAMTTQQLTTIKEMELTADSLQQLAQERGLGRGFAGGAGGGFGGLRPPAGLAPGGGGALGGGFGPGGGFGGREDLSPEELEAALAERLNSVAGSMMTGVLVSLLEARAEGEVFELATPNQDFQLQRSLFEALTEAAGLDRGEIRTQAREGKTLLEVAEANGVDVNALRAQVVAAETERVNQAVVDGSLEKADADEWLTGLEERVTDLLEGTLGFGGRGAPGNAAEGP